LKAFVLEPLAKNLTGFKISLPRRIEGGHADQVLGEGHKLLLL
jgi:hypothetical protein